MAYKKNRTGFSGYQKNFCYLFELLAIKLGGK